ncbi:MAG: DegT/DnrJ/EryC1/StrS family aminotransferase [Blautia sp.]
MCDKHGAVIIENVAEFLGVTCKGPQMGTFRNFNAISFNGNNSILA